jgi:hypothetical protein
MKLLERHRHKPCPNPTVAESNRTRAIKQPILPTLKKRSIFKSRLYRDIHSRAYGRKAGSRHQEMTNPLKLVLRKSVPLSQIFELSAGSFEVKVSDLSRLRGFKRVKGRRKIKGSRRNWDLPVRQNPDESILIWKCVRYFLCHLRERVEVSHHSIERQGKLPNAQDSVPGEKSSVGDDRLTGTA